MEIWIKLKWWQAVVVPASPTGVGIIAEAVPAVAAVEVVEHCGSIRAMEIVDKRLVI